MRTLASPNAIADGRFGASVSAGPQYVYVGAQAESATTAAGTFPGAGRAYIVDPLFGNVIAQLQSLHPSDNGRFSAVGAHPSSAILAVGASLEGSWSSNQFFQPGRAYIFNAATGAPLPPPLASPSAQQGGCFGYSVAVYRNLVVIGAPGEGSTGTSGDGSGSAYLWNVETAQLVTKYTSPNTQPNGNFGYSVSIIGDALRHPSAVLIGAPNETSAQGQAVGAAYIFPLASTQPAATLQSPHPTPLSAVTNLGGQFGYSVQLGVGDTGELIAAVGAPTEDVPQCNGAGRAYTFDLAGNPVLRLFSPNAMPGGYFGASVAVKAETPAAGKHNEMVVGAPGENNGQLFGAGNAYAFQCSNGHLIQTLSSPNAQVTGGFAGSAALGTSSLILGAQGETVHGLSFAGRAYVR
ncbi:MAG TPA: hypothetical protein VMD29_12315 [Terracidiphilus sp.]|nr:hypothetical protein [Terracidiphilus sp.]